MQRMPVYYRESDSLGVLRRLLIDFVDNFLVDLLWISSDPSKQALRDKFAHTLVIRKDALPAGTGQIVYRTYTLFGSTLMCAEVRPDP